jgi:hypothetical protein
VAGKTFTQEELNTIVADRLRREATKFADYDVLKVRAARADELELGQKTAEEKALAKATKAEQERDAALATAKGLIRKSSILNEATSQGAADANIIAALLASSDQITVDEAGNVAGAKEAVAGLLKASPFLKKGVTAPATSGSDGFSGAAAATLAEKIRELDATAMKSGATQQERQVARAEARSLRLRQAALTS